MIKGGNFFLITLFLYLISFESFAFNQQNEQQMYIGCYQNSKPVSYTHLTLPTKA